jgi:hypothetical protein
VHSTVRGVFMFGSHVERIWEGFRKNSRVREALRGAFRELGRFLGLGNIWKGFGEDS